MNSRFSLVGLLLAGTGVVSTASAYEYTVENEVIFGSGSIIRVIEYGPDDRIGVWVFEGETLSLIGPDGGTVATCDRTLPGDEIFGEYGGNAINIDGTKVQYVGVDGQSLAGWSIDCLTGEVDRVGGFIPTYTDPAGTYSIGYNGATTSMYFPDGTTRFLHNLEEQIFYYSGNEAGDLLGGYQSVAGDIKPYVNVLGRVDDNRGVAVIRETPLGDTAIIGQVTSSTSVAMRYMVPAEENAWTWVEPEFVIADANPDGFIFNRYSIGNGQYGEDILGSGCVITDEPDNLLMDINQGVLVDVDEWCQSFVRQNNLIYVATGDSWQNSYKLMTLRLQAAGEETLINGCFDSPPVGDGWGWDGLQSCQIESSTVASSGTCFDSPPLGDGWGWDGTASCRITASDNNVVVASAGTCFDSPPLGDGFGWDGVGTCTLETGEFATEVLYAYECFDYPPLGDGLGWHTRFQQDCPVNDQNATGVAVVASSGDCVDVPPLGDGRGFDGVGQCNIVGAVILRSGYCIDTYPIGDGFGWDGTNSCTLDVGTVVTTVGDCVDVAPQGDGWGWDGTASCRITGTTVEADEFGCVDVAPVGDGWGWNGTQSCQIQY